MPLAALQSLRVDRALALQQLWASLRVYMAKLASLDEADAVNSIAVAAAPTAVEQQVPGVLSKLPVDCSECLLVGCARCWLMHPQRRGSAAPITFEHPAQVTQPKLPGTRAMHVAVVPLCLAFLLSIQFVSTAARCLAQA